MKPARLPHPWLAAALALLGSAWLAVAGTPVSFQQLPAGDAITVVFTSEGCFHHYTYEFDFRRGADLTAKVTQIEQRWNEEKKTQEVARRIPLGTVKLSAAAAAGLDRLFAFYRTMKRGGCTTVNQITATHRSGDTVLATESFTDATCATDRLRDVTLLPFLAEKLKPRER